MLLMISPYLEESRAAKFCLVVPIILVCLFRLFSLLRCGPEAALEGRWPVIRDQIEANIRAFLEVESYRATVYPQWDPF